MKRMMTVIAVGLLSAFTGNDTVRQRFAPPPGYQATNAPAGTFANWLQNLPLLPAGTPTLNYRGEKARTDAYTAGVVKMSVGDQNLQQCADAVIRLRAEYLFAKKDYNAIRFHFTSGFLCDFVHYADGYRYQQNGSWKKLAAKDYSYENFLRYMNLVFSYAGTLSLEKELRKVASPADLQIGDVFIKGGSPGHCFIVVNTATAADGKKTFLLAQSFMPAQNIQIVQNGSPWFTLGQPARIPYGEVIDFAYLRRF